jgi:hypothetical protein
MSSLGPRLSNSYCESIRLLRQLARLAEDGQSQSPEAQRIRAAMEASWYGMSEEEQNLVDGLSADLWTLTEEDPLGPTPSDEGRRALQQAWAAARWQEVSALLRDCPRLAVGVEGALLRAQCWLALGEEEIAAEFTQHAARQLHAPPRGAVPGAVAARRKELQARSGAQRRLAEPLLQNKAA